MLTLNQKTVLQEQFWIDKGHLPSEEELKDYVTELNKEFEDAQNVSK